jgi:amidophosphoribosyltransferase
MCGIIGISGVPDAAEEIFLGLQNLQHRGQDGGGIAAWDDTNPSLPPQCRVQRGAGLVDMVFPIEKFRQLKGTAGIGHTRYSTTGSKDACLLQPFVSSDGRITIAHNGNILNCHRLAQAITAQSPQALLTDSDTEVILHLLQAGLKQFGHSLSGLQQALQSMSQTLVGSYSVVGYVQDLGLIAFRDPNGLRPLLMGRRAADSCFEHGHPAIGLASESVALEFLAFEQLDDILPGECVVVSDAGPHAGQVQRAIFAPPLTQHCMFEWVYFSRVESTLEDLPVYQARFNLGLQLAQQVQAQGLEPDIVVPIPETSRSAAIALAEALKVPFREGLIKNRYVNRTFILESQSARLEAIRRKLTPVACEVRGKKILLVDDSIVRGNTAIKIIELLRKAGASQIYLASTCPPIRFPCYYGVDFPDQDELLAGCSSIESLREQLMVDALVYQSLDGLNQALDHKPLCNACLTGDYPTSTDDAQDFTQRRSGHRQTDLQKALVL